MLNLEDALRKEPNPCKGNPNRFVYIFECKKCKKERRVQPSHVKIQSGYCTKCVKRFRHPFQTLYNTMLSSIKRSNRRLKRNLEVTLTFEEFLFLTEIKMCGYCGNEVFWKQFGPGPYNLDRKNNTKGYTFENVIVCCNDCNQQKRNWYTQEEFSLIKQLIEKYRNLDTKDKLELEYTISTWNDNFEF